MARMVMTALFLVVACMVVAAPYAEAITCGQVVSNLVPCLGYLKNGGVVPPGCCSGVTALNNAAKTTPDRQTACGCLKSAYAANSGINPSNAAGLPGKCGVKIPYKISPSTDCTKSLALKSYIVLETTDQFAMKISMIVIGETRLWLDDDESK
ncbi:hypothetical protein L1887_18712 [Cichorium endivia]|nr:hypothetical protein L1887_18712 [Cichorium endivia]